MSALSRVSPSKSVGGPSGGAILLAFLVFPNKGGFAAALLLPHLGRSPTQTGLASVWRLEDWRLFDRPGAPVSCPRNCLVCQAKEHKIVRLPLVHL